MSPAEAIAWLREVHGRAVDGPWRADGYAVHAKKGQTVRTEDCNHTGDGEATAGAIATLHNVAAELLEVAEAADRLRYDPTCRERLVVLVDALSHLVSAVERQRGG